MQRNCNALKANAPSSFWNTIREIVVRLGIGPRPAFMQAALLAAGCRLSCLD
jgi:hypothetical protein